MNIDVKCRDEDDCTNKEWEIHGRASIDARGPFDVGPNLYALGAGFALGPYVGLSVNIVIAGTVALETELHYLRLAEQQAGPIIAAALGAGPTAICMGQQRWQ